MYKNLIYEKLYLEIYMHLKLCMHENIDLITNPFKYKCETCPKFLYIHLKKN